jgi:hypothetical protein
MARSVPIELHVPGDLARFKLPAGVQTRLQDLLDRQTAGTRSRRRSGARRKA